VRRAEKEPADEVDLFGVHYKVATIGFHLHDRSDRRAGAAKERSRRQQLSDFVIVTIHAHEPGNWSQQPADFLPVLAHAAIDAGADEVHRATGLTRSAGVDVYTARPIFYSLGDFIFQLDLLEPVANDLYEQDKMDAAQQQTRSSTRCGTG